jgi:hypothetical protein
MRAILNDATAGRFEALSHKMTAIANRTLRLLRITPRHPATRALASQTVPGPTTESFVARFRKGARSTADRIRETVTGDKPVIGPAPRPAISPGAHPSTIAPPNMNRMIRDRKGKK